ncbi:hypothetical protein KAR91_27635, partial [Candidatus Pacearchaeota archaeon]|nr:hypothetical protein [Candidatus Pacearchaeota archaeon]
MEILQIIHNLNPGIEIIRFSAVGIAVAAVVIAAGSLAYSLYIMRKAQQNQEELAPNSLDEFAPTQAREGLAIPLIYGKVRLPGNIMWYGNLITEKITEDTGGKGGGGGDVTTGYKYYIDVWQGLSIGKVVINGIFVNGDQHVITIDGGTPGGDWIQEGPKPEKEILVTDLITNDGTQNTFPTQPGEFAQKLPGVAHVFFQKWFIGENVSQIPITHFMLERTLVSPVTPANGLKGANPAAVVHDLLSRSGVPSTDFDFTSFNAAAAYWEDRYELNLSFTAQADTAEMIRKVLGYVGGILALDNEGRCTLKTLDPSVTPSATL